MKMLTVVDAAYSQRQKIQPHAQMSQTAHGQSSAKGMVLAVSWATLLLFSGVAFSQEDGITPLVTDLNVSQVKCEPQVQVESSEFKELGKPARVVVNLFNPLDNEIKVTEVEIKGPDWLELDPQKIPITVLAGKAKRVQLKLSKKLDICTAAGLRTAASYNYTGQDTGTVQFFYSIGDGPYPEKASLESTPFSLNPVAPPVVILLGGAVGVCIVVILYWVLARKMALRYVPWALLHLIIGTGVIALLLFLKPKEFGSSIGIELELLDFGGGVVAGISFLAVVRAIVVASGLGAPPSKQSADE